MMLLCEPRNAKRRQPEKCQDVRQVETLAFAFKRASGANRQRCLIDERCKVARAEQVKRKRVRVPNEVGGTVRARGKDVVRVGNDEKWKDRKRKTWWAIGDDARVARSGA